MAHDRRIKKGKQSSIYNVRMCSGVLKRFIHGININFLIAYHGTKWYTAATNLTS